MHRNNENSRLGTARAARKERLKNRSERTLGKARGAQEPECTCKYMRIPSTAQRRPVFAQ
jgi:hypothetical protein